VEAAHQSPVANLFVNEYDSQADKCDNLLWFGWGVGWKLFKREDAQSWVMRCITLLARKMSNKSFGEEDF